MNEGVKRGTPSKKTLFYRYWLVWRENGQIGTDIVLIITSTGNELLRNVNINDFELP